MVSVNYQGAYATIGHKGVQSNLIFLAFATKGHLIVYNLLYLPPIKGKTVLYLKIISHKGTISGGWSYKYKIRSLRILSGLLYVQGAL